MPALVKLPVERMIKLNLPVDENPDQDAYVKIRPATQREVEQRDLLNAEQSSVLSGQTGQIEIKRHFSYAEQQREEVYLTLADSNLEWQDPRTPEASSPLFRFQRNADGKMRVNMTRDEFASAWGILPENWATAIHSAVLEVNPQWNPSFRGTAK